jgi:predicted Zn-dependent protease
MKKWIGLTVLAMTLCGCLQKPLSEARVDSYDRWCKARARIFCGMAEQALQAGRLDEARDKADQSVELAPKFVEARMVLARIMMEQNAYVSAIAELQEACELNKESSQGHYLLGVAHEKASHIDKAVESYKKSYELDEKNVDAIMAVGEVLAVNGRAVEGSKYVEDYLSKNKAKPAMEELAARLAMSAKRYELAAAHYAKLTRRNGDDPLWRQGLARALFAGQQYSQAAEALEARTSIEEPAAPVWVYAMLGDCYMASARCERAQRVYAKALSRKPNSAALTIKIAQANLACGDTVAASRAARKALQISPGRLDATMVLGYSLLKDKKPREAERLLSPAVMLHPRSATLMCLLGRCHAAAGDSREARNCYRQAIILDPDSEVARKLFYRNEQEISANTAG